MIGISIKGDNMIKDQKSYATNQTKHMDRKHWWKRSTIVGDIQYINTRDNSADGGYMTKTLGTIMHNEHVYRATMGLYGSPHKFGRYKNSHEERIE